MGSSEQPSEAATSFLALLPEASLERLRGLAKPVRLEAGDWLFHEGDDADCAYIVQSGRLHVVSNGQLIRTVRRGAVIGELAPLTGGARTASVRAQRDCHLWRLGRDEFEQLITADQQFALALCRTLGSKLAEHRLLHEAVFASLAVPGIYPPVPTSDHRLLVDGGVLDNLPVGVMATEAEGPVIAVDVTRVEAWRPRHVTTSGSWRARTRRLITGQDGELPRLAETMFRTLALGSSDTVAAARQHADIVIRPVVERAGLLDWKQLPHMRDAGRDAVQRLIEADPEALRACL